MIKTLADRRPQLPAVLRYSLAIVAVVAAVVGTQALGSHSLAAPPTIFAILISTWYGGIGPGLVAWLGCSVGMGYLLLPAVLEAGLDGKDLGAFLLYNATAFLALWITSKRRPGTESGDRTRMEASVREARLGAFADSSHDLVFEFDADGTYIDVWTRDERLLFRPRDELLGRTLAEVFDEEWARHHVERLRRVLASGEPESWEYRMDLPAGRRWFLGRMSPVALLDRGRRTVACLIRDITEHKRQERRQAAQHSVMQALADSESLAVVASSLLSAMGENMEWDWGALWTVGGEPNLLRCEVAWHAESFKAADFDAASCATAFKRGEGWLGGVWENGKAEWMLDVNEDCAFLRKDAAARAALRSAVAFPILDLHSPHSPGADGRPTVTPAFTPRTGTTVIAGLPVWQTMGGEVLGIIELFSREPRQRDDDQLAMLTVIGGQIGQFVKRRRAEADVRRSEKELRDVIETIPAMVWSASPDGSVDFINRRWQEVTGLSPGESLGWKWERAIHPEELERYLSKWRASLATGQQFETELRLRGAQGGDYRWFMESGVPLKDDQGKIRKWYGVLADIEVRKRAEEASRESEEKWKAVFENNPTMYFMMDAGGTILSVNPFGAEQLGYRVDELIGRSLRDVLHEADVEDAQRKTAACLEQLGRTLSFELRKVRRDGEVLWVRETARAMLLKHRPVVLAVCEDITERKRAEYLTGQVFESAPDGISVVGTDYRYQRVNPVYERNWRMPAERIVGKHVADLLGTKAFEQTIKPNLDRCFAGEEVRYAQWFGDARGRSYLAVSYSPLRPSAERVEAALVITRDLTDQALASEGLRAAQAELAHVNRVATMGQLTASIAHEVNQPIAAAVTNAQAGLRWLAARAPDLEEARKAFGRIIADGKRAAEVIARIRSLIKKAPARQDRLDVNEAILDVVALTGSEVLKHGVSMKTRLAKGLPPVTGDRVQLQQVLLNLILNALEAMSGQDAGPRELLIRTDPDAGGGVLVSVRDTGPGLGSHSADQLFEPFYTTKASGLGMGLSICRSIVEAHGGRLRASANEPRGAVFQFTLPAEDLRPASRDA